MTEIRILADDEFERFDEAQPFLQLLADLLNRIVYKVDPETDEADDETPSAD